VDIAMVAALAMIRDGTDPRRAEAFYVAVG